MATDVPQREFRNNTAELLRRVEAGETLRITVHGHPVAELVPIQRRRTFVPFDEVVNRLRGLLDPDDPLAEELRELDVLPLDAQVGPHYGRLVAATRRSGRGRPGVADSLIAATALAHRLPLITCDRELQDFDGVDVVLA